MKYFDKLYTLIEIAFHNSISDDRLSRLYTLVHKKKLDIINEEYPEIKKFIPYCKWYVNEGRNILAMSSYMYDFYCSTGMLPNLNDYDYESDVEKKEWWMYNPPICYELSTGNGFEFANKFFPNTDIWGLFLSGNARMNYYQDDDIKIEDRIKLAMVEYMLKRPQFFSVEDFYDNEELKRKYKKRKGV